MLDYKLLEAVAVVVREGGFDKAAQVLHLTQSAVSQRVKLLEEYVGQILLARTSPPTPTAAGRRILKHYLQVKRLEDDLVDSWSPQTRDEFVSLSIGINSDSLATWFVEAVRPFLEEVQVVLDLKADDQDQTLQMLRDGEVAGCISSLDQVVQGCRLEYLGCMDYQVFATPGFAARWFPDGFDLAAVRRAPILVFNRLDMLHHKLFRTAFGEVPADVPIHYLPSTEKFPEFITLGFAYGLLPHQQSEPLLAAGRIVELAPSCKIPVKLYWHCWNLKSDILEKLTRTLVNRAPNLLK